MKSLTRRLRRVLFLIPYVSRHPEGVSLADLAPRLGITPKALERELAALTSIGVPNGGPHDFIDLHVQGRGAAARVLVAPRRLLLRPPRLTAGEADALLLGAEALRRSGVPSFDEALARAAAKLRARLRHADGPPAVVLDMPGRERRQHLEILSRASRDRRAVELDYASIAGQRRRTLVVEPYGLLNHRGGWYVIGKSVTHAEDRLFVFKGERILAARPLDRPFTVPKDFDLRDHATDRLFIAGLAPVPVKLRLRGAAIGRLRGHFRNAAPLKDGTVVVRTREVLSGGLAAWVLRQGPEVEVVSPPRLAAWVRTLAARVVQAHDEAGVKRSAGRETGTTLLEK